MFHFKTNYIQTTNKHIISSVNVISKIRYLKAHFARKTEENGREYHEKAAIYESKLIYLF